MDTLTIPEALGALEACWEALLAALPEARRAEDASCLFAGRSSHPGLDALLREYGPALSRRAADLADALGARPGPEARAAACRGLERLLLYPRPAGAPEALTLAALEDRGLALVPFLDPDDRRSLARRYGRLTPVRRMLPNQFRVWRALAGD